MRGCLRRIWNGGRWKYKIYVINSINWRKYVILNINGGISYDRGQYEFNFWTDKSSKETSCRDKRSSSKKDELREVLNSVSEEIKRVLDENNFTQEDLCRITNMSQSNISKIQNGKVVPRIETLQKIAAATHTRLVISFESMEGEEWEWLILSRWRFTN